MEAEPEKPKAKEPELCCSLCGKNSKKVKKLIAGPHVFICNECTRLCNDIIDIDKLDITERNREIPIRAIKIRADALRAALIQYPVGAIFSVRLVADEKKSLRK